MSGLLARIHDLLEKERLQPDLSRAARFALGFMGPIVACLWWNLPLEASFAAFAAQNVAGVDIRGSYPLRLSVLLVMTAVLAGCTWLGGMASGSLPLALAAVVVVTLAGGVWRQLSPEFGPSLAVSSSVLLLFALALTGEPAHIHRDFLAALIGGLWGVIVQLALWPFRAQHPLRRAVSDSWVALSDLLAAMSRPAEAGADRSLPPLAEKQAQLRTALDQATADLERATARHARPYLRQLEALNLAAARIATQSQAIHLALEGLETQPHLTALAPSFAVLLNSLTNTTRLVALTVVSRQPAHLAACEVRLRRLNHLLRATETRVQVQTGRSPAGQQLTTILRQMRGLLASLAATLHGTIARADEHAAFSLELFDLQTWTLRPLASSLNLRWHPDRALRRFIGRTLVLQLVGVACFKYFALQRGYWLPLTMLVILQPDYGSTRKRAVQRVWGTLAGSILASMLLWLKLPPGVIMGAMAATMFGFGFWLKRRYSVAVFLLTLFVVLVTESATAVTLGFTAERLGATLAGCLLALLAARLFWPVWEHQRFPALLAQALRANRDYLRLVGRHLNAGGSFDAAAVAAKRAAEIANSQIFSSLERMSGDPDSQQFGLAQSALLANGSQRLTGACTVVALQLHAGQVVERAELNQFVTLAAEALERLAEGVESGFRGVEPLAALHDALDRLELAEPTVAPITPLEHSAYTQFARCATELGALLLAVLPADETTAENDTLAADGSPAG